MEFLSTKKIKKHGKKLSKRNVFLRFFSWYRGGYGQRYPPLPSRMGRFSYTGAQLLTKILPQNFPFFIRGWPLNPK